MIRRGGRVVRQGSAKPSTPVQFRSPPSARRYDAGLRALSSGVERFLDAEEAQRFKSSSAHKKLEVNGLFIGGRYLFPSATRVFRPEIGRVSRSAELSGSRWSGSDRQGRPRARCRTHSPGRLLMPPKPHSSCTPAFLMSFPFQQVLDVETLEPDDRVGRGRIPVPGPAALPRGKVRSRAPPPGRRRPAWAAGGGGLPKVSIQSWIAC